MDALRIDLDVDESFSNVRSVILSIRPSWQWDDVRTKSLTAGITNKITGYYLKDDPDVGTYIYCTMLYMLYIHAANNLSITEKPNFNIMPSEVIGVNGKTRPVTFSLLCYLLANGDVLGNNAVS